MATKHESACWEISADILAIREKISSNKLLMADKHLYTCLILLRAAYDQAFKPFTEDRNESDTGLRDNHESDHS